MLDLYMRWSGMTRAEEDRQLGLGGTEPAPLRGKYGRLCESVEWPWHIIEALAPEALQEAGRDTGTIASLFQGYVPIPATLLQYRQDRALAAVTRRYGPDDDINVPTVQQSVRDFIALAADKEAATGVPCTFRASF